MRKIFMFALWLGCFLPFKAHTQPRRIAVIRTDFSLFSGLEESVLSSDTVTLTRRRDVTKMISGLNHFNNREDVLGILGVDTAWITTHPREMFQMALNQDKKYDDGFYTKELLWNSQQLAYIYSLYSNKETYLTQLDEYLSHHFPLSNPIQYKIVLYDEQNCIIDIYTSKKDNGGIFPPYTNLHGQKVYNYRLGKWLTKLFGRKDTIPDVQYRKPAKGNKLLNYLIAGMFRDARVKLYKLDAASYEKEIAELSTDFQIISTERAGFTGRILGHGTKIYQIRLHNEMMLSNVNMQFFASAQGGVLYSRDSIKNEYREMIHRVQSCPIVQHYLQQDSTIHLDIYYFDNKGINQYLVDKIKWYKETELIGQAIVFETTGNFVPTLLWCLFPNDTLCFIYGVSDYYRLFADLNIHATYFSLTPDPLLDKHGYLISP